MRDKLLAYLKDQRHYWWTVSVLPGILAILYLYQNNFYLVNSWEQFAAFILYLILLPSIGFVLLDYIIKQHLPRQRYRFYYCFLLLHLIISGSLIYFMGWRWKALLLLAVLIIASAFILAKHYKKLVLLLGLLNLVAIINLGFQWATQKADTAAWAENQAFENWEFNSKPNIYVIQPDGYVSASTLKAPPYDYNNDAFFEKLNQAGFNMNEEYRSNYPTTLSSNAALFSSQHHYFNQGHGGNELPGARALIMGENPVLRTLKNNAYQTNALLQSNYLLLNRPEVFYDRVNISSDELPYFPLFNKDRDLETDLKDFLNTHTNAPQFYFIEILEPAHVTTYASRSQGKQAERKAYLQRLENVNKQLLSYIELIEKKDPTAIIILAADHGGFVGFDSTEAATAQPITNKALKKSIFSALLAVKGPTALTEKIGQIPSSVSLFPELFRYLADQKHSLNRDQGSYLYIKHGKQEGVYKYLDSTATQSTELLHF